MSHIIKHFSQRTFTTMVAIIFAWYSWKISNHTLHIVSVENVLNVQNSVIFPLASIYIAMWMWDIYFVLVGWPIICLYASSMYSKCVKLLVFLDSNDSAASDKKRVYCMMCKVCMVGSEWRVYIHSPYKTFCIYGSDKLSLNINWFDRFYCCRDLFIGKLTTMQRIRNFSIECLVPKLI